LGNHEFKRRDVLHREAIMLPVATRARINANSGTTRYTSVPKDDWLAQRSGGSKQTNYGTDPRWSSPSKLKRPPSFSPKWALAFCPGSHNRSAVCMLANVKARAQQFVNGEVHDWYRILLGYSDHLVSNLLDRFDLDPTDCVLDPFCGSGTTLVDA
jgi:hypothetical protein